MYSRHNLLNCLSRATIIYHNLSVWADLGLTWAGVLYNPMAYTVVYIENIYFRHFRSEEPRCRDVFASLQKRKYNQFFIIYFLIYIGLSCQEKKYNRQVPTGNDLIGARYKYTMKAHCEKPGTSNPCEERTI